MADYTAVKASLLQRKNEILERLGRVEKSLRHSETPLDDDSSERAIETQNDEVLEALNESMRKEAMQINHAISLIDEGRYGICEYCGGPIGEKRMAALPEATRCISCAR